MKRIIIGVIGIVIIGSGAWIINNIASAPEEVPQTTADTMAPNSGAAVATRRGTFDEQDRIHKGTGEAVLENGTVRLSESFTVTNGPDLYVYLVKSADGKDVSDAVSLGKLKSPKGGQSYTLPANHQEFKSVVIYCRAFKQTFSVAPLT